MEKDNSIALQKQVRDNAADLRSEFLDMKSWEEQMKKADKKLQNNCKNDDAQLIPPVRKKKSNSRPKLKPKENGTKAKRIKSYDYSAWDHYDADKASEEVGKESESEDSGDEVLSREELEKKHEEATKQKVMGNIFVQEKKWDEAMACYNEAIKIFPYDAVFYANRALCHLKMDNLYSAEADCTSAIQRDELYVKAYHRRATARMALKQYEQAVQDLKHLLTLDSTNKEAKRMLSTATKYLESSKPAIITSNEIVEKEKLLEIKTINESSQATTVELVKEIEKTNEGTVEPKTNKPNAVTLPDWLPVIETNVEVVQPIKKSPHQRSKTSLKKIPVNIGDFTTAFIENSAPSSELSVDKHQKETINVTTEEKQKSHVEKLIVENRVDEIEKENDQIKIPPVPKTSVQFLLTWRKYTIPKFRYNYLKQLPAESIPKLFQDSMESSTFSEILSTLISQFVPRNDAVFNYLKYLSEIKRFSTLTMFLRKKEKEDLRMLFDYCRDTEDQSDATIKEMRMKYEI